MKLNLKKVLPIAAVGLMAGITFAHAATLSDWPSPFVQAGQADVTVVIGADAQSTDTIAASDFTVALQAALGGAGGGEGGITGEVHLIDAPGNEFNYGDSFADVETSLGESDLPTLLEDGRYRESKGETENDVLYTQVLRFTDNTDTLVFDREKESPKAAGTYLYLSDDDNTPAFTYELEFDNPVKYTTLTASDLEEDFKLTTLGMFGREYTIVDAADNDGDDIVDELTLMAGALKASQWEYSNKTYTLGDKTYNVEVKIISDTSESVILVVNGEETDELQEGDTYTLQDGTRLGVVDVVPNEGAEMGEGSQGNDLATFYLGAEKIVFSNDDEVEINGQSIDNTNVIIEADNANELKKITLEVTPEDDVYLAAGEEWTDTVLGRLKITFQGLEKTTTTVKATTSGDDGEVTLINNAGDELTIPVVMDDANDVVYPGDDFVDTNIGGDAQSDVYTDQQGNGFVEGGGNLLIMDGDACGIDIDGANVNLDDCEGVKLLVVGNGGEARIVEIKKIDKVDGTWGNGDDEVTLRDEFTNEWTVTADGTPQDLGSFATVQFTINTAIDVDNDGGNDDLALIANEIDNFDDGDNGEGNPSFENELAGEMAIEFDGTNTFFYVYDNDGNNLVAGGQPAWRFDDDTVGAGGDLIITNDPTGALTWVSEEEDSDYDLALDALNRGAIFRYDSKNQDELTFEYPEEEVVGKAYVSEELANIPELQETGTPGATLGSVVFLDNELTPELQEKNLIVVGGSAVNTVAADLLGLPYPTYGPDGFNNATGVTGEGQAILKIFENPYASDKIALLVAGWSASDTRKAATALTEQVPGLEGKSEALLDTTQATAVVLE